MSDLRVDLIVPMLRLGVGPFAINPIAHFLGAELSDLFGPLLAGPIEARRLPSGALVEVYPLRFPDGDAVGIAAGSTGELGIANVDGQLVLTVPRAVARWVGSALGPAEVGVREIAGRRVEYTVAVRPGLRATWPLGSFGEVAVETPVPR